LAGAFQTTKGLVGSDAFVTKLNADGSALVYSTYLGGNFNDEGYGIAVFTAPDGSEYAYVTGGTASTDFPVTPTTAYQTANNSVVGSAFVTVLSADGLSLVYSTYLGGTMYDYGAGIAVDGSGNAYVTGATTSPNFPVKPNPGAYQTANNGRYDAFVAKLNPTAAGPDSLVYSTYLGGTLDDYGRGIAVDGSGAAYVPGGTYSGNFPTTPDAFQVTSPGLGLRNLNGFVAKISQTQPPCNSPCNPTDPPGVGGSGGPPPADPPALPPVP